MSRAAIARILHTLGRRRRGRPSGRQLYAVSLAHARQIEMPFMTDKMNRLGVAEIPPGARITPDDFNMAKYEKPLPRPKSEADVEEYKTKLFRTNLYPSVVNKIKAFSAYSPGGDTTHWSIGQFIGDNQMSQIDPKENYLDTYHKLYPFLPVSRQRIHERALQESLNPLARARGGEKHFTMVIGPPGAGKSTVGVPYAHTINPHYTTINVDEMRKHLPEYEGWNSHPNHKETAYLTYGPLIQRALEQNHHLLYDATGGKAKTMEDTFQMARDHGYTNHLILVHRPAFESMANAWDRFMVNPYGAKRPGQDPSRFVDPIWAYTHVGEKPKETYHYLKNHPLVDSHAMIDPRTPRGEQPVIMERGHVRR